MKDKKIKIMIPSFKFNEYDALILIALNQGDNCPMSYLKRFVDISPNNLTNHVKKLENQGLIKIKDNGKGKPKEISIIRNEKNNSLVNGISDYFLLEFANRENSIPSPSDK